MSNENASTPNWQVLYTLERIIRELAPREGPDDPRPPFCWDDPDLKSILDPFIAPGSRAELDKIAKAQAALCASVVMLGTSSAGFTLDAMSQTLPARACLGGRP